MRGSRADMATRSNSDHDHGADADFPSAPELAAYRAWLEGLGSRAAVEQFLGHARAPGASSRAIIGRVRRRLIALAQARQRDDLAVLFQAAPRSRRARAVPAAIDALRRAQAPPPRMTDAVGRWLPARVAMPLVAAGVGTLADLVVRLRTGAGWWRRVPGIGRGAADVCDRLFKRYPVLRQQAERTLVRPESPVMPLERLRPARELDGSQGTLRAPRHACVLAANNDYDAVQAWLSLQDAAATRRAYRKEAERLLLWAIVERGKPLSSLTTEDAIAYRTFLRRPTPKERWVGPVTLRASPDWRPFQGPLSARSAAYALQVANALFRWLTEQRYLLANPFAGVKVKGASRAGSMDARRAFTEHEWRMIRDWADGAEFEAQWGEAAVVRMRFLLDFLYATGLRASELVGATLGDIRVDGDGNHWLDVRGKGATEGNVVLPSLARTALTTYLRYRGLPVLRTQWVPATPLVASIAEDPGPIGATRLWTVMKRYFGAVAAMLVTISPATAVKARAASPHWMRHTHATHGLERGVDVTAMRDNLRHSSIAVTSTYLHADDRRRASSLSKAFTR
jgi:site-specific recombinase XerD